MPFVKKVKASECFEPVRLIEISKGFVKYKTGEYMAVTFTLKREGYNPIKFSIKQVKKKDYENEVQKYVDAKRRNWYAFERILSLFMSRQELIEFRLSLNDIPSNFNDFIDHFIYTINKYDYKNVDLSVKILETESGFPYILPSGVFIKRTDDPSIVLQYDDYEEYLLNH